MPRYLIGLVTVLALLAGACGGGDGDAPVDEAAEPAVGEEADEVSVDVQMGDIFYQPTEVEIPAGVRLIVSVSNEGGIEHDFELETGETTGMVDPGETATGEFGPLEESTVAFCTVPGHREAGMEFDITVTE